MPRRRNPNEVEHDHHEEIRIVDEELWAAVRTRMDSVSKLARLITSIENGTDSEYGVDLLVAEAKKKRAQVDALRRQRRDPPALPTPAEITARVFELEERITTEPLAAGRRSGRFSTAA